MVSPRLRPVAFVAFYGALSLLFCSPLFAQPQALGGNDWDQHLFYYASVLKSVVEYGQMPFWNPWYCGGNVLWQNPQIALLSPVFPLTAVMSLQLAMKVNIVLHYWVGFVGMHLVLRRVIGLAFLPLAIYLSVLVTASGAPAIHLRAGHSVFLPGFYLPLLLFFFFRTFKTGAWRDLCLSAAILALMIWNGGTHILPMAFASLGVFAVTAAIARRDWRPVLLVVVFAAAGLAYAAPKLLPVSLFVTGERFWDTRNPTEHPDRVTPAILYQTYLVPTQQVGGRLPQQRHGWHEYGNYIAPAGVVAIAVGVVWALLRRRATDQWFGWSLAVTTIVMFALSLGEFGRFSPAILATHLPLFSSFRIPSRYTIPFVQFGALALAWAFSRSTVVPRWPSWGRTVLGVVCVASAAQLILVNRENFTGVFRDAPFETSFARLGGPRQVRTDAESNPYGAGSPMLRAISEDRAFYYCYESLQLVRTSNATDLQVTTPDGLELNGITFSPNRLDFNVSGGREPARVALNYNWSPGWTSSAGPIVSEPRDAMATVIIAPGQTGRFSFTFFPEGLWAGTGICLAALVITAIAYRRRFLF